MKISVKPQIESAMAMGRNRYAIDVAIGTFHVMGCGEHSGEAINDLVRNTLICSEGIAKANGGVIQVATQEEAKKLVRGIVLAAIEMACLRHDLCLEEGHPGGAREQCAEIVADTFNALHGVDTCVQEPAPEVAELYRVLGVKA